MAFQQPASGDSPADAHYLLPFVTVGTPRPCIDVDNQPASLLEPARSDIDLQLTGEIFPVSERCLSVSPPSYVRGASRRGDARSVILPSSRDYDASHPSLDAHSRVDSVETLESESFIFGEFNSVCLVGFFFLAVSGLRHLGDSFVVANINTCPQLLNYLATPQAI